MLLHVLYFFLALVRFLARELVISLGLLEDKFESLKLVFTFL